MVTYKKKGGMNATTWRFFTRSPRGIGPFEFGGQDLKFGIGPFSGIKIDRGS